VTGHELRRFDDAAGAAAAAAAFMAELVSQAVGDRGRGDVAVSGGRTPRPMFEALAGCGLAWGGVTIFQVDERVAPDGDGSRNLTALAASLAAVPAVIEPMDVTAEDLDAAADRYAGALPGRFDVVHLGLGADGHTASLVPGDPVLDVADRLVALTQPYQEHRRMTLTYPGLARADVALWLVAGADKQQAIQQLLDGDTSIPAGRVEAARSVVFADAASL
jgi:6-phosphogluconolactonase